MKKTSPLLILLTLLLASCGQGGKTNASLKVSSSFALTNSSFDGGLILYGKSGDKSFTRALAQTANTSGNVINIELPNGRWSFFVTAWKNSSGVPMTGDVFCGEPAQNPVDLKGIDTKVDINVSQIGCRSSSFTTPTFRPASGNNGVKKLALISCNAFYEDSGTRVTPTTGLDFCGMAGIPLDMRNQARSFKLKAESKALTGESVPAGFSSTCQNFDTYNGSANFSNFRIPSSNTPVSFELYAGENCIHSISTQPMLEGLSFNYGDDKVLLDGTGTHAGLLIASNETKKGFSHFYSAMPTFKCGTSLCIDGSILDDFHYFAARPSSGNNIRLVIDRDPTTAASDYIVTDFTSAWSLNSCGKSGKEYYCDFTLTTDNTNCADGGSNYCWSTGSKIFRFNYKKKLADGSFPATPDLKAVYVFKKETDLSALAISRNFTGKVKPLMMNHPSSDENGSLTGDYGILHFPRHVLSPAIAGLISLPGQNCETASARQVATLKDDGGSATFEISVRDSIEESARSYFNQFFCDSTDPDSLGCGSVGTFIGDSAYEKKITVRRLLSPGNWELFIAMEFSCDPNIKSGQFEERKVESSRNDKTRIVWLQPAAGDMTRIEFSQQEKEWDTLGRASSYRASVLRLNSVNSNEFEISGMHYDRSDYAYPAATFKENANRYFIRLDGGFIKSDMYPIQRSGSDASGTPNTSMFTDASPGAYTIKTFDSRSLLAKTAGTAVNYDSKFELSSATFSAINTGNWEGAGPNKTSTELFFYPLSLSPSTFDTAWSGNFFSP